MVWIMDGILVRVTSVRDIGTSEHKHSKWFNKKNEFRGKHFLEGKVVGC